MQAQSYELDDRNVDHQAHENNAIRVLEELKISSSVNLWISNTKHFLLQNVISRLLRLDADNF